MQLRLAAILAADVVGYARLLGSDEMRTLTALKSHRRELVDSAITEHRGRIVKTTGDGMLVEFASVLDAVGCAVTVQRSMLKRNSGIPEDKQIIFRIGISRGQRRRARGRLRLRAEPDACFWPIAEVRPANRPNGRLTTFLNRSSGRIDFWRSKPTFEFVLFSASAICMVGMLALAVAG